MMYVPAGKLETLAEAEGYDSVNDMIESVAFDSVVPAICVSRTCDYTADMEPDQDAGWCENCNKGTLASCLRIAGYC